MDPLYPITSTSSPQQFNSPPRAPRAIRIPSTPRTYAPTAPLFTLFATPPPSSSRLGALIEPCFCGNASEEDSIYCSVICGRKDAMNALCSSSELVEDDTMEGIESAGGAVGGEIMSRTGSHYRRMESLEAARERAEKNRIAERKLEKEARSLQRKIMREASKSGSISSNYSSISEGKKRDSRLTHSSIPSLSSSIASSSSAICTSSSRGNHSTSSSISSYDAAPSPYNYLSSYHLSKNSFDSFIPSAPSALSLASSPLILNRSLSTKSRTSTRNTSRFQHPSAHKRHSSNPSPPSATSSPSHWSTPRSNQANSSNDIYEAYYDPRSPSPSPQQTRTGGLNSSSSGRSNQLGWNRSSRLRSQSLSNSNAYGGMREEEEDHEHEQEEGERRDDFDHELEYEMRAMGLDRWQDGEHRLMSGNGHKRGKLSFDDVVGIMRK